MEKQIICYFSGWFEVSEETQLINCETDEVKTAKEWMDIQGNLDNLILYSFSEAESMCTNGEFEELYLKVEESL